MTRSRLIPVDEPGATITPGRVGQRTGEPITVFVHGYRSMASAADVEAAKARVRRTGAPGRRYLLGWMAGRWRDSATVAGLQAAYKVARLRHALAPWTLALDAGVVGVHEIAQFKRMEARAERVGRQLPGQIAEAVGEASVHLIGHSLGARVVHHALASGGWGKAEPHDAVLLAGAADLDAADWPACIGRLRGRLYNAYSPRDRVLRMTPDLRRRVGSRPMAQVVVDGQPKVVNHELDGVSHVQHWTRLPAILAEVWPRAAIQAGMDGAGS